MFGTDTIMLLPVGAPWPMYRDTYRGYAMQNAALLIAEPQADKKGSDRQRIQEKECKDLDLDLPAFPFWVVYLKLHSQVGILTFYLLHI